MLPVFRRIVVKGEHRIPVLDQLGDRLVIFHTIGFDEEIEGGVGFGFCLGLKHVVQTAFSLDQLRHRVEHIAGFMEPAALFFRGENLAQRGPGHRR